MSLIVMLLVQILITNHIAGCQEIVNNYNRNEKRDIFLSYLNKSSLRVKSQSLIEPSETNRTENNTKNMLRSNNNNNTIFSEYHNQNLDHQREDINTTTPSIATPSTVIGENEQLIKIVMEGLGLTSLPDLSKANISQYEYRTKYNEYLDRLRQRALRNIDNSNKFDILNVNASSLYLMSIFHNSSDTQLFRARRSSTRTRTKRKGNSISKKTILLRFPLELGSDIKASDIEEANIRLLLITSPALAVYKQSKRRHNHKRQKPKNDSNSNSKRHEDRKNQEIEIESSSKKPKNHFLNMKVYQLLEPKGKTWIDAQKIEIKFDRNKMDESYTQWLQFDVTKAVEEWVVNKKQNLGLEIQCDNCLRIGARIIDDISGDSEEEDEEHSNTTNTKYDLAPVLNIIGRLGTHREKRSKHYHIHMTENHKSQKTNVKNNCYKDNQRCCRHSMEVVFKEIKGFEFIIQPKVFDAGYCRGRCPPRYNPAHHHALLQSLIWKQNKQKVPRPCCAPSKLVELEVLHVDEKDKEKLKISTWTDMRVLECACS